MSQEYYFMTSALYNISTSTFPLHTFRTSLSARNVAERLFAPTFSSIKFLTSAPTIEDIPLNLKTSPEVIFIGRANVGKSTLINYICGNKDLAISSKKPGRTQALNFFGLQRLSNTSLRHDLILVDAPGYGQRGRAEWGQLFDHYIRTRDTLRCIYILINAQHGITEYDKMMLRFLHSESAGRPFKIQPIITKTDKMQVPKLTEMCLQAQNILRDLSPNSLPPIFAASGSRDKKRFGRIEIRSSIVEQCGVADKKMSKAAIDLSSID